MTDKTLGMLTLPAKLLMMTIGLFASALILYGVTMVYKAANQPINLEQQLTHLQPLMKEIEANVKDGKVSSDLKLTDIFKKQEDGSIIASAYKDGILYLNTMKERKDFYVDDKLLAMKPVVADGKVIWNCYYVQAGKIVGEDKYSCVKTSDTMQRRKRAPESIKIALPYNLFDDRSVLAKTYLMDGKEVPKELLAAIEEEKKIREKYAKLAKNKKENT